MEEPLDTFADPVVRAEWRQLTEAVIATMPAHATELWLGQLVFEVQRASDRALTSAKGQVEALMAAARMEATSIAEEARRPPPLSSLPLREPTVSPPVDLTTHLRRIDESPPVPADVQTFVESPAAVAPSPGDTPTVRFEPPPSTAWAPPAATTGQPVAEARRDRAVAAHRRLATKVLMAALALLAAAAGLLGFERYGTAARERTAQHHLASEFARLSASQHGVAATRSGSVFALLSIPRLAVDGQAVVEGASLDHLRSGPAHDARTPSPGQGGATVIDGHRRTYGAPFGQLGQLRAGDIVSLRTPTGLFVYRVSRNPQILQPRSLGLQLPSAGEVEANGGSPDGVDQVLMLATGVDANGASIEVVVATMDQASTLGAPAASQPGGVASLQLRSIPGQRLAVLLSLLWLSVLGAILAVVRRVRASRPAAMLPAAMLYAVACLATVLALYQLYSAVDRMLPGMY